MSAEKQSITKCHYRYSQINNFISVKDFMFVRENGTNHLLIRFVNLSDFTVNSLAFTVTELDASGKVLGKFKIKLDSLEILAGSTYAPPAGFKVHSDCCDCVINIRRAKSENYLYRIQGKQIVTDYCKPSKAIIEGGDDSKSKTLFYVKSSRAKKIKASVVGAAISLLIIITFNAARPFAMYYKDEIKNFLKEYAETIWAESTETAENNESSK